MPDIEGDGDPSTVPARAAARVPLAAGAGIAAGALVAAAPAGTASAYQPVERLVLRMN